MSAAPEALVLDDGELDDVAELLEALGVPPERRRGANVPDAPRPPTRLFVATPRRAEAARGWPPAARGEGPVRIAVVEEDSNALRASLRRAGFDYLVRRPVHPYALRLLLLRILYAGDERRREARHPVGLAVDYRAGLRARSALLAELSQRGGRLLTDRPLRLGARIHLRIPSAGTGRPPLGLRAKVVRCVPRGEGEHLVALSFEGLSPEASRRLDDAIRRHAEGPASHPGPEAGPPAAAPSARADRRKHRRGAFEGAVRAALGDAERVLVGRDLSVGGMRVDDADLEPGGRVRVALYPSAHEEPVVLDARVVRSDAASGTGLRFESVPPGEAARLEALVAGLPAVEALADGEAEALGSIVSEILERS